MDLALKRHPFLVTGLAPLIPHLVGSAFNIWYNLTVIDTVDVASRIEALNKTLGTLLLVSKATRTAMRQAAVLRELPPHPVKGVAEPVAVYTT